MQLLEWAVGKTQQQPKKKNKKQTDKYRNKLKQITLNVIDYKAKSQKNLTYTRFKPVLNMF